MKTIIIKTQAELDAMPDSFYEYTTIRIDAGIPGRIVFSKDRINSRCDLLGSTHKELIITCPGAGRRQAFMRGKVPIGFGNTDDLAVKDLISKL